MRRLNYMPVFFVAAAVSMGTVMEGTKASRSDASRAGWMQPAARNIVVTTTVMYDRVPLSLFARSEIFDAGESSRW